MEDVRQRTQGNGGLRLKKRYEDQCRETWQGGPWKDDQDSEEEQGKETKELRPRKGDHSRGKEIE
jgi:hypothetical protein